MKSMQNMTCSEIDLNRPATRWCEDARSPEVILDAWTNDIKSAYDRLHAQPAQTQSRPSNGDVDDGAFPDLLFA